MTTRPCPSGRSVRRRRPPIPTGLFNFTVTGVTTTNNASTPNTNDLNVISGALTINQPINTGGGSVRFYLGGDVTQVAAGTITAAGLSVHDVAGMPF